MTFWILAALALFVVQSYLPSATRWQRGTAADVAWIRGNRDGPAPPGVMQGRMERALRNLAEALVVFLPLALLAEIHHATGGWSAAGAGLFVVARVAYLGAYATGIPWLRSLVWGIGHAGLAMMVVGIV